MANKNGKLILQDNTLFPKTTIYNVFDERGVSLDHLISGLPLGMIIPSVIIQADAGLHLLDGGELARNGVYAEFCTWLISKYNADPTSVPVVAGTTDAEKIANYQAELDAHNGQCGKFAICSDFIKLPKITRFIEGLTSLSNIGTALDAGLPNITGSISIDRTSGDTTMLGAGRTSTNNALSYELGGRSGTHTTPTYNSTTKKGDMMDFDASRSNGIYGNNNTVQPDAIRYPYYIVVATIVKTQIIVDIDQVISDLNLKADKDGGNIEKENFKTALGYSNWNLVNERVELTTTKKTTKTAIDLSTIIPNWENGRTYEVIIMMYIGQSGSTYNDAYLYSDMCNDEYSVQQTDENSYNRETVIVPIHRYIYYMNQSSSAGTLKIRYLGSRRVE